MGMAWRIFKRMIWSLCRDIPRCLSIRNQRFGIEVDDAVREGLKQYTRLG